MTLDLAELEDRVRSAGTVARIVIVESAGSVPREPGASMLVWDSGQSGTIGGGALEHEAAKAARDRLSDSRPFVRLIRQPLGPGLGQCCGGSVTLLTEVFNRDSLRAAAEQSSASGVYARPLKGDGKTRPGRVEKMIAGPADDVSVADGWVVEQLLRPARSLWIFGAGHVGRAIVRTLAPLPEFAIVWVDTAVSRYPTDAWDNVEKLAAECPEETVAYAPDHAEHLVLTFSHALDLAICDRLLARTFRSAGLIGSATKWARFRKRLLAAGHSAANIERIDCPIGDAGLGKHPQAIAIGVAARLLSADRKETR